MRPEYRQPDTVEVDDARRMVKTFDKVERGTKRLEAQLSAPKTFGQYVGRVAMDLGIEDGVRKVGERDGANRWRYDSVEYRLGSLGSLGVLADYFDRAVAEWFREHGPKPEATVTDPKGVPGG